MARIAPKYFSFRRSWLLCVAGCRDAADRRDVARASRCASGDTSSTYSANFSRRTFHFPVASPILLRVATSTTVDESFSTLLSFRRFSPSITFSLTSKAYDSTSLSTFDVHLRYQTEKWRPPCHRDSPSLASRMTTSSRRRRRRARRRVRLVRRIKVTSRSSSSSSRRNSNNKRTKKNRTKYDSCVHCCYRVFVFNQPAKRQPDAMLWREI